MVTFRGVQSVWRIVHVVRGESGAQDVKVVEFVCVCVLRQVHAHVQYVCRVEDVCMGMQTDCSLCV